MKTILKAVERLKAEERTMIYVALFCEGEYSGLEPMKNRSAAVAFRDGFNLGSEYREDTCAYVMIGSADAMKATLRDERAGQAELALAAVARLKKGEGR